jgi:hypothetical protein
MERARLLLEATVSLIQERNKYIEEVTSIFLLFHSTSILDLKFSFHFIF